jgi:hypothetical protein
MTATDAKIKNHSKLLSAAQRGRLDQAHTPGEFVSLYQLAQRLAHDRSAPPPPRRLSCTEIPALASSTPPGQA